MKINHFRCPTCGRLYSVQWPAAWCPHHDSSSIQPAPPEWIEADWTRMLPVTRVDSIELPPEADEWYVIEQRNRYGYPNNEIPGTDKREWKKVAGPMSKEDAYAYAESAPRDDVPRHVHYFSLRPGDLMKH